MSTRKNVLLVPTDFTEVADVAADHAINIAKIMNWEVYLLHILNKDTKTLLGLPKATIDDVNKKLEEKVNEYNNKYNFKVNYIAREGSIFDDIAEVSKEIGASFVVMGTHGKHGIQHFIGSYAFKVITSSDVPYLVVQKKPFTRPYKKIVLPLDNTLESRQKIKWAIYIAKFFDAKILLKIMYQSSNIERYKVNVILQHILKIFNENNVEYEYEMKDEPISFTKQVIRYAKDSDADMIMVMTNPNSASFPNFLFNKDDEYVLFNEHQIPVMCINPIDIINVVVVGL